MKQILPPVPSSHSKISIEDKEKCPVYQIVKKSAKNEKEANQKLQELERKFQNEKQGNDVEKLKDQFQENEAQIEESEPSSDESEQDDFYQQEEEDKISEPNTKDPKKQKKAKMQQGGCPFMPQDAKRNPGLEMLKSSYDVQFISKFGYMLDYQGFLNFGLSKKQKLKIQEKGVRALREKFDQYPIYLKHTLFHNDEGMEKTRKVEICQRFFIYDKLREKGNRYMQKRKYLQAIECYERAFACFKWLEVFDEQEEKLKRKQKQKQENNFKLEDSEEEEEKKETEFLTKQKIIDLSQQKGGEEMRKKVESILSTPGSNVKFDVQSSRGSDVLGNLNNDDKLSDLDSNSVLEDKKDEEKDDQDDEIDEEQLEMKRRYKLLMTTYTDDNIRIHDGQDAQCENDKDMRASLLLQILYNLAVAYMSANFFSCAQDALDEAIKLTDKQSILYLRRAQCIAHNMWSSSSDLKKAKEDIEIGIRMKQYEKMFSQKPGLLKVMNIENHNEFFPEVAHFVMQRLKERLSKEKSMIQKLFERSNQIDQIRNKMIEQGKTPLETQNLKTELDEWGIMQEMILKYNKAIEFHQDRKDKNQVKIARFEQQKLCQTVHDMKFYLRLDFAKYYENVVIMDLMKDIIIDLKDPIVLRRLDRLRNEKVAGVFEKGQYNIQMLQYAMDSYFQKKKLRMQKENPETDVPEKKSSIFNPLNIRQNIFRQDFWLTVVNMLMLGLVFSQVFKNTFVGSQIFGGIKK